MVKGLSRLIFLSFCFLFFSATAFAIVSHNEAKIFAVTSEGKGLSADLILDVENGSGKSWVALDSLVGTSTQSTAKIAVQLAKNYFDKVDSYDFKFDINSNASLVDGPSAGAAMALLVISSLQGKKIPANVSLTGTINSDGSVGAVGGVFEKAKEASRINIALFMIPDGEARQIVKLPDGVKSIDLVEYAETEWGLKIVEVETIDDVLKYAYSDIGKIDINRSNDLLQPEFIPEPIAYSQNLDLMHGLTRDYISRAETAIGDAKRSLNSTLLDNADALDTMLAGLNAGEKFLAQSKLLLDQNYLYSAANYAFLAKINSLVVKDVADNPSILSPDSTVFALKLNSLKKQIEDTKAKLNGNIPVDFLEWNVAAKQRLSYAELNVKKLVSSKTIVVSQDGLGFDDFQFLQDFESAVAWAEIANDFYAISMDSNKFIAPNEESFGEIAQNAIVDSENKLNVLQADEFADAQRRLGAALIEKEAGWFVSAAFDAVSASALINAEIDSKDKSFEQLNAILEGKIQELDKKISESRHSFVWPQLYLDHSKYFLESAKFYKSQNKMVAATDSARNGVSLIYLASSVFDIALKAYDKLEKQPLLAQASGNIENAAAEGISPALLIVVFGGLLFIVVVLSIALVRVSIANDSFGGLKAKILKTQHQMNSLEKSLISKKIDSGKFAELSTKYANELAELNAEKDRKSRHIMEIDLLRAKILAYEHALRDLKIHYSENLISENDYLKNLNYYKKQVELVNSEIFDEKKQLQDKAFEEKPVKKTVSSGKRAPVASVPRRVLRKKTLLKEKD